MTTSGQARGGEDSHPVQLRYLQHRHSGSAVADREVLIRLFKATGGESWKKRSGWASNKDVGDWFGVTANAEGQVVGLDLSSNNLSGAIPKELLGGLQALKTLVLGNNSLTGDPFQDCNDPEGRPGEPVQDRRDSEERPDNSSFGGGFCLEVLQHDAGKVAAALLAASLTLFVAIAALERAPHQLLEVSVGLLVVMLIAALVALAIACRAQPRRSPQTFDAEVVPLQSGTATV